MSRHPDGQVGHDPPGAVAGEDGHAASGFPILRLKPGGNTADFGHGLAPGPIAHLPAAMGLGQENTLGPLALPLVDALQRQIVCTEIGWHGSSTFGRSHDLAPTYPNSQNRDIESITEIPHRHLLHGNDDLNYCVLGGIASAGTENKGISSPPVILLRFLLTGG